MRILRPLLAICAGLWCLGGGAAGALQFTIDEGNTAIDAANPGPYGTIDVVLNGDMTVTVTVTSADVTKFAFAQEFGFNINDNDGAGLTASMVTAGWALESPVDLSMTDMLDGLGSFEVAFTGPNPSSPTSSLAFTLSRTSGFSSIDPLILQTSDGAEGTPSPFALHLVILSAGCDPPSTDTNCATGYANAHVTGEPGPHGTVPEPGTLLLLGSGLAGLGYFGRRRRARNIAA
jgi:hypothetical protein